MRRELTPEVLVDASDMALVGRADLGALVDRARRLPRRRSRILLHAAPEERLQEMVIVMTSGEYVPPLINDRGAKSFLLLAGSFTLVRFEEDGALRDWVRLAADDADAPFFVRLNPAVWHMCVAETPEVVFLETLLGPHGGTVFAPWAPAADSGEPAQAYYRDICRRCLKRRAPAL